MCKVTLDARSYSVVAIRCFRVVAAIPLRGSRRYNGVDKQVELWRHRWPDYY